MHRRHFLQQTAASALALSTSGYWLNHPLSAAPAEGIGVAGKSAELLPFTLVPLVAETPVSLLDKERITPKSDLFVRNNQDWKEGLTLEPYPRAGWTIELTGLIDKPVKIAATDLEKLEQESHEMVLQCSGSSRSLYSKAAKTEGTQWGRGGIGNVVFRGVPLAAVLEHLKVKVNPEARFVTANGIDEPPPKKDDFEHSLLVADVLAKSLFALEMNGEPLPALHGGPVRLVTPGFYGTMQVKWLKQLRFEKNETTVSHQVPKYRMPHAPIPPGTDYKFTVENSRPNYQMRVKSVLLSPEADASLPASEFKVRGVAFNDGAAAMEAVLISTDRGRSWSQTKLEAPENPTGWTKFETAVKLEPGVHEIWSRAIDQLGRSQPLDGTIYWNPHGYEWNGVEKIKVKVA